MNDLDSDAVEQAVVKREVDTIWTIPNLFTLIRLLCLPLFLWLLFGLPSRQAAAWLLGGLCATDWVDGYLARRLGQTSEFGKKFDPTVDRAGVRRVDHRHHDQRRDADLVGHGGARSRDRDRRHDGGRHARASG